MKHIELLNTPLKSIFFCDLFETYDVVVSYEYDRTNENMPDEYSAEVPKLGMQFTFDTNQILKTLFIKPIIIESYNPLEPLENSFHLFTTKLVAQEYASTHSIKTVEGKAEFLGEVRDWIRFEYSEYSTHYEFIESKLNLITLQANDC